MTKKQKAHLLWDTLIIDYRLKTFKLSRLKFDKYGDLIIDKNYHWTKKHFPNILKEFDKRVSGFQKLEPKEVKEQKYFL